MTPETWRRISGIFHDALERPPGDRRAYLDEACGAEQSVRTEVDRLLAAHENAGRFGEVPVRLQRDVSEPAASEHASSTTTDTPPAVASDSASFHRPARLFVSFASLAAAATVASFVYAAWLLILSGGTVQWLGWSVVSGTGAEWHVSSVDPQGPAAQSLRPGDRLISMNGAPPVARAGIYFAQHGLDVGEAYGLVIERGGEPREVRLVVGGVPYTGELTWFAVSLVWCAVGLFIGFARPDAVLARLACLTSLATGLVFLQVGVIHSGPLWQPLHAVLGFHFLSRFPTGRPARGVWRILLGIAYAGGIFCAALNLFSQGTRLLEGPAATVRLLSENSTLFKLGGAVSLSAFAVAVVGMMLVLPYNYRRLRDEDHRRRVRWVVYASIIGLTPQIWWIAVSVIEQTAGPVPVPRFDLFVCAVTVTIPLFMAYAVVKHRVLDIKVVIRRGVQYLLARRALQAAAALPFLALIYIVAVNLDMTLGQLVTETGAYLFWLALAGLALKFRRPIQAWLDRRFFREEYDRERLVLTLIDDARRVESLAELSRLVSVTLRNALHPTTALVWYRDPRERAETAASSPESEPVDFPSEERWLSWLERQGTVTALPAPEEAGLSRDDAHWLRARGIDVIVPIADGDDRLTGVLLVGAKQSEEPYDGGDTRFLNAVAKQAAVVRETLRLRARLSEETRVRHDVLARLDDRLPDLLKECPACGACFDGALERCPEDEEALVLSLPVSRTIDGRYRLERLLGKGGMGAVYAAFDQRLDREVAVKIMLSRAFGRPGALRRFRREARVVASVVHRGIVTVYDVGSFDSEGAYIVMERLRGETLRTVLDREPRLAPSVAAQWFEPLLDGMAAAHARGIVHRDLKPENVMGHRDESGRLAVKILDFGLAKLRDEEGLFSMTMTAEGTVMGTPDYMPPEQLLGREVDHRSDIFAVGVMLLEALTGGRTFEKEEREMPIRDQSCQGLPRDGALHGLLRRCLAADPNDRPPSAAALAAELLPLLNP